MLEAFKRIDVREGWRKAIHIPTAILAPIVVFIFGHAGAVALCIAALAYIFITGYFEKRHNIKMPVSSDAFEMTSRGKEVEFPLAQTLFLVAVISVVLFLPFSLTFAALGVLGFGDGAAALGGMMYGEHKIPYNRRKSVEGSVIGTVIGFGGALLLGLAGIWLDGKNTRSPLLGLAPQLNGTWMPMVLVGFACLAFVALWVEVFEHFMKRRYDRRAAFTGISLSLLIGLALFVLLVLTGTDEPLLAEALKPIVAAKAAKLPFIYLAGTAAGMLAESAAGKSDNLVVPLVAAGTMVGVLLAI
ncbi:MAG: hypothetical protein CVT47_00825 [Thermoplasmata archaeon HGW-Thermoplasmata-2]|nr:MAG: hypothetical protein CVT47_00825 [Thermoplasmata archaeon HGW-Thermoplasmata-2]